MIPIHKCIMCENASSFDDSGPISITTGNNLCWSFRCNKSDEKDAYSQTPEDGKNEMWFDLISGRVWVDGGNWIAKSGCVNYNHKKTVNEITNQSEA